MEEQDEITPQILWQAVHYLEKNSRIKKSLAQRVLKKIKKFLKI